MSDACGSDGVFSRFATDTTVGAALLNQFTSADKCFALDGGASLKFSQPHVAPNNLTGSSSPRSETVRPGLEIVDGDIPVLLTPETLQFFIPYITGMAWDTLTSYPVTAIPGYYHGLMHRDATLNVYDTLRVSQASISSSSGEPIKMVLSHIGRTRLDPTEAVISTVDQWPDAALVADKSVPYMHDDVVITVDGNTHEFRNWAIKHNSNLVPAYFGSTQACGVRRNGLTETTVQLAGKHTFATAQEILQGAVAPAGLNVVMTLTHPTPGMSASFRFQCLQIPEEDNPVVAGENLMDLTGTARTLDGGDSGGAEWIITNDATPT